MKLRRIVVTLSKLDCFIEFSWHKGLLIHCRDVEGILPYLYGCQPNADTCIVANKFI